jgi:hypothetical protein
MKKFANLKSLLETIIAADPQWDNRNIYIVPGPDDPDQPADLTVVCSVDGGAGLILDGALDNISWQIRLFGDQALYDSAEALAETIDLGLLSIPTGTYSGERVVTIQRVGGRPQHLLFDDAERTQFVCSYFFDVESGLLPI